MKTKDKIRDKEFDTVKIFRDIKEHISKELVDMSTDEILEYLRINSLKLQTETYAEPTCPRSKSNFENHINNISIYPNPASNQITLDHLTPDSKINIIDITGRILSTISHQNVKSTIDISQLSNGIYFINVNGVPTSKFIKID